MKYRSKPRIIEANQWRHGADVPGVQVRNYGGGGLVHFVVTAQGREVKISDGEWIVAEEDGVHFYPIAANLFPKLYEPAE